MISYSQLHLDIFEKNHYFDSAKIKENRQNNTNQVHNLHYTWIVNCHKWPILTLKLNGNFSKYAHFVV